MNSKLRCLLGAAALLALIGSPAFAASTRCALADDVKADASRLPATVLLPPPVVDAVFLSATRSLDLGSSSTATSQLVHELELRMGRRNMALVHGTVSNVDIAGRLRAVVKSGATGDAKLAWAKTGPIRKGEVAIGSVLADAARAARAEAVLYVEHHATATTGSAAFLGAEQGSSVDVWLLRASDGVVLYHGVGGATGSPFDDYARTLDYLLRQALLDLPTRPPPATVSPATDH